MYSIIGFTQTRDEKLPTPLALDTGDMDTLDFARQTLDALADYHSKHPFSTILYRDENMLIFESDSQTDGKAKAYFMIQEEV